MKQLLSLILLAVVSVSFALQASNVKLPIVKILGESYYVYEAKKGETLFSIARERGWNDAELQRLNPDAVSPLKKGDKLYYPVHPNLSASKAEAAEVKKTDTPAPSQKDLYHTVKRGENIYSISRIYGVSVDNIYKLNPKSREGVAEGDNLLLYKAKESVPAPIVSAPGKQGDAKTSAPSGSGFYTIQEGDSPNSIATSHRVSVASIMKENPGLSAEDFKEGSVIKLPRPGSGIVKKDTVVMVNSLDTFSTHKVAKDETWRSIAAKENVDVDLLRDANPEVDKPKKNQTVTVPRVKSVEVEKEVVVEDPRELSRDGVKEIYEDIHEFAATGDSPEIRVAIVTESENSKKDMEFIRGFLTGINQLKRDYKVALKVINGAAITANIAGELDEFKPTIVFSTSDKNLPSALSDYADSNEVTVVNTFDVKNTDYTSNPYLIQLLTPSEYFNSNIAAHVNGQFGDRQLVLTGTPDSSDQLASALIDLWNPKLVKTAEIDELSSIINSDTGKYVVYGYPTKKQDIAALLSAVSEISLDHPLAEVTVLGRPNWVLYDEALSEELHRTNALIPSRFFIDKDSDEARRFEMQYKALFNRTPTKSVPLYAAVGYDTSLYFIPALVKANGDVNSLEPSSKTVQSDFDLKRVSNWGGMLNPPTYLVRFTPFDTIEKTVVR